MRNFANRLQNLSQVVAAATWKGWDEYIYIYLWALLEKDDDDDDDEYPQFYKPQAMKSASIKSDRRIICMKL